MPRFSIKDLMISTTLLAVGGGALVICSRLRPSQNAGPIVIWVVLASFATIGAGLFAPFHKKGLGALAGVALAIALGMYLVTLLGINDGPRRHGGGFSRPYQTAPTTTASDHPA